jgi:hypothetical protein
MLLRMRASWDVTLCHWVSVSDVSKNTVPSSSVEGSKNSSSKNVRQSNTNSSWTPDPCTRTHYIPSKCHGMLTQWHSITSYRTCILWLLSFSDPCSIISILLALNVATCHITLLPISWRFEVQILAQKPHNLTFCIALTSSSTRITRLPQIRSCPLLSIHHSLTILSFNTTVRATNSVNLRTSLFPHIWMSYDSWQGQEMLLFCRMSRPALKHAKLPLQ